MNHIRINLQRPLHRATKNLACVTRAFRQAGSAARLADRALYGLRLTMEAYDIKLKHAAKSPREYHFYKNAKKRRIRKKYKRILENHYSASWR